MGRSSPWTFAKDWMLLQESTRIVSSKEHLVFTLNKSRVRQAPRTESVRRVSWNIINSWLFLTNAPPPHPFFFSLKCQQTYLKWIHIYSGLCSQVEMDWHWQWLAWLQELEPSLDCHPLNQGAKQGVVCEPFISLRAHLLSLHWGNPTTSGFNAGWGRPASGSWQPCFLNLTHNIFMGAGFRTNRGISLSDEVQENSFKMMPIKRQQLWIGF